MTEVKLQTSESVCAVVVTYHPDIAHLSDLLASVSGQVQAIVVVDNTPLPEATELRKLLSVSDQPIDHLIQFGNNRGVAAAQNAGITWAIENNFGFILLLDHDSVLSSGMVQKLRATAKELLAGNTPLAAVGPSYANPISGRVSRIHRIGTYKVELLSCPDGLSETSIQCDTLISSGTLIPVNSIEKIGLMEEALFIDGVDHEWCLRARGLGYTCYVACNCLMQHRLGTGDIRYWLGRWRYAPCHSFVRHYYMLRNAILLGRRRYVPLIWTLHQLANTLALLLISLVALPKRATRFILALRAIGHGLRNRSGPL